MRENALPLKLEAGVRLGTLVLRALAATWRVKVVSPDIAGEHRARGEPIIYILWHGQLLPLLWAHRNRKIAPMISDHRDGELIARVATSLGFRLVRGSTTRGGARALVSAVKEIESGYDVAVTPDGPRGPAKSVAPGAAIIAQRSGAPMVPVAMTADRAWRLRSWDGFVIPKPFARVTVAYSQPIRVAADAPREVLENTEEVRRGIDRAEQLASHQ